MGDRVKVQKHWLHDDHREHKIEEETSCRKCAHAKVCGGNMSERCSNYLFGDSREKGCQSCTNKFTRFDPKEWVPCFLCPDFLEPTS